MILSFETSELRSLCEDESLTTAQFELEAESILSAVADLASAPSLADLPPGILETLDERSHYFRVDAGKYWLIFCANHKKPPLDQNGSLEWGKVMRVKVLEIKHHG